jgi:hypothetical protein
MHEADFVDLVDLLLKGGPAVPALIFAYMWWRESRKNDRLYERAIVALEGTKSALESLIDLFHKAR